jgi:hypothetical protein
MKRLALTSISMLAALGCLTAPAVTADLDGPYYRQSDVIIQRRAPPVLVRERIIERYYEPAPTYYPPRAYAPEAYYDAPRGYAPTPYVYSRAYPGGCGWHDRRAFFGDSPFWWAPRRDCGY